MRGRTRGDAPAQREVGDPDFGAAVPRLRVAQVGPDPGHRGGMAAVLRILATSPLARRHDLTYVTTWRGPSSKPELVMTFAGGLARLVVWCLRPGPRVVHVHAAVRGSWYRKLLCVAVARALRRPVVLQVHAGSVDIEAWWESLDPVRRRLISWAFGRADRVLTVSVAGAEVLRRRVGLADVLVVPNPVPAMAVPERERAANGTAEILYLGGFEDPAKGGAVLLDALPAIVGDGRCAVVLAGPGDAPDPARLDGRRAAWAGWLDEGGKAAALARADLVVFPSLSEGLPVALLEAMVAGRAIVAARTGGMAELLTDGVDAVLVEPGDAGALAAAVRQLAQDPSRRARLGAAARRRVADMSPDEVSSRLEQVYRELLERRGRRGRRREGGRPRALLVCSPGGHLQQMLALRPAWEDFDVSWITYASADVEHLLAGEDVRLAHGPTNRSVANLLRNLAVAWRVIRERRPEVILSTGAGVAPPFFVVGRLLGVRLVYVESLTRTQGLSLSGRLVAPLAHDVFVQWPGAVSGRARYVGSIL